MKFLNVTEIERVLIEEAIPGLVFMLKSLGYSQEDIDSVVKQ